MNPGISAWLTLAARAKLAPGENVLILGATGVTGKLATKIAKLLGAARVVAAGRNAEALSAMLAHGADATIQLDAPASELTDAFVREAGSSGFQVVIDYVWGQPAEAFLAAITRKEFAAIGSETRYVQVGESAGATISLPAAVLRSTPLTIMGTAGMPPREALVDAMQQVMANAASGGLQMRNGANSARRHRSRLATRSARPRLSYIKSPRPVFVGICHRVHRLNGQLPTCRR